MPASNDNLAQTPADTPLLAARGLVMAFPGVRALDRVDFELRPGEVHALLGENGAGKSTLIKVLSGVHRPAAGAIRVAGREFRPRTPRDAESGGVSTVFQEVDLIPTMTVAENICLGRQPTFLGLVRARAARGRARAALARLGLALDVSRTLADYPIGIQQMVAIARALDVDARVLILDEPTSSLDADETCELFRVMRALRSQGLGIVFVSHFLDQVYEISDRITVLRNGARVGSWRTSDLPKHALIEAMTGRAFESARDPDRHRAAPVERGAVLEFTNLGRARAIAPAGSSVCAGAALGLGGLLGSGRSELARLLFGADAPTSGEVRVEGTVIRGGSVRDAIAHGMAFTPEDRKAQGLVLDLSLRENIILALQARRGPLNPLRRAEQQRLADRYIRALAIKTPGPETPVRNLSGGNQQKVLLARWLATNPKILILDEPTRGIDVGARAEIEALIALQRAAGVAVVLISSELDELVRNCDRVLVLRDRRPIGELEGPQVNEATILSLIAGAPGAAESV